MELDFNWLFEEDFSYRRSRKPSLVMGAPEPGKEEAEVETEQIEFKQGGGPGRLQRPA